MRGAGFVAATKYFFLRQEMGSNQRYWSIFLAETTGFEMKLSDDMMGQEDLIRY